MEKFKISIEKNDDNLKIDELKNKLLQLYKQKNIIETQNKIVEFINTIKSEFNVYKNYQLYHLLIGSTPPDDCAKFDFPDEYSIEKFINEKL